MWVKTMAQKDWKVTSNIPRRKRWKNKHRDEVVHVVLDKDKTWFFMVKDNRSAFVLGENLTKPQAIGKAKDYMQSH